MWKLQGRIKDKLIPGLLNLIYPTKCPVCKSDTDNLVYSPICTKCFRDIAQYSGSACRICSLPLVSEYRGVCGECLRERPEFSRAISYGIYKDTLKEAIGAFKFSGIKRLGLPLGRLLTGLAIPKADCIIPVPMEISGLLKRGFNQSLILGVHLSKALKIPVVSGLLYKKRMTPPQVGLNADERALNLRDAFGTKGRLDGKTVLLIDDVMTTGATVKECSKELKRAGAAEITVVVLARSAGQ